MMSPGAEKHLKDIGFLIEQPPIYGNLTAAENLKSPHYSFKPADEHIQEALDIVNLTNTGKKEGRSLLHGDETAPRHCNCHP